MSSFMERLTGRKPTPAQSAKDRLKFVLVTDRTAITPEELRKMQVEILDVIRKYCRVNEELVEMKFEQRDRDNYLVADIPLAAARPDEQGNLMRFETTITVGAAKPIEEAPEEVKSEPPEPEPEAPKAEVSEEAPADDWVDSALAETTPSASTDKLPDTTPEEAKVSSAPVGVDSSDDEPADEKKDKKS